jgi:hypothetical protein
MLGPAIERNICILQKLFRASPAIIVKIATAFSIYSPIDFLFYSLLYFKYYIYIYIYIYIFSSCVLYSSQQPTSLPPFLPK